MNIYKLNYSDKETAIADLIAKRVYVETTSEEETTLSFGEGIQAVVECGIIALSNGTYDEQGIELTAPIFAEGYHYDVMSKQDIVFQNEIFVNNPKYTFA
jgi:hypothetical protein